MVFVVTAVVAVVVFNILFIEVSYVQKYISHKLITRKSVQMLITRPRSVILPEYQKLSSHFSPYQHAPCN